MVTFAHVSNQYWIIVVTAVRILSRRWVVLIDSRRRVLTIINGLFSRNGLINDKLIVVLTWSNMISLESTADRFLNEAFMKRVFSYHFVHIQLAKGLSIRYLVTQYILLEWFGRIGQIVHLFLIKVLVVVYLLVLIFSI